MDDNVSIRYEKGGIRALFEKNLDDKSSVQSEQTNVENLFDDDQATKFKAKVEAVMMESSLAGDLDSDEDNGAINSRIEKPVLKLKRTKEKNDTAKQTVFVGNIPAKTKKKELEQRFKIYGNVESVRIRGLVWKESKIPLRAMAIRKDIEPENQTAVAYIKFSKKAAATKALAENNNKIGDRTIRVNLASDDKTSDKHRDAHSIFIGNVPRKAPEDDVRKVFESCGTIDNIRLIRDKETGQCQGFGYLQFQNMDSVELALTLNDKAKCLGRAIRVKRCQPPRTAELKLRPLKRKLLRDKLDSQETDRALRRKQSGMILKSSSSSSSAKKPKYKQPLDTRKRASVFEKPKKLKSRKDRQRERKEKFRLVNENRGSKKQSTNRNATKHKDDLKKTVKQKRKG